MWTGIKSTTIVTDINGIHYTWEKITEDRVETVMKDWVTGTVYEDSNICKSRG